jgi:hypothetical protein
LRERFQYPVFQVRARMTEATRERLSQRLVRVEILWNLEIV